MEGSFRTTLPALVNPPKVNKVPVRLTSLAPPPILNSISVSGVPEHTIWFGTDGSAPAYTIVEAGVTVISICSVTPAHGLVLAPSVVTVNEYVTGSLPTIGWLGLPDIVTIPPILSASSTKSKFIPTGKLAAAFTTLAKVLSPTTEITIGVISSP